MRAVLVLVIIGCGTSATPPSREEPKPAAPPGIVRASLAVDGYRACAIEATGKVACWGPKPVEVPGVENAAGIAAGPTLACAWTTHGAVACWGDDPNSKFGPTLDDVRQVSVGTDSACALHATGRISCWENGSREATDVGVSDAVEIAGAYGGGAELLCARLTSGQVTCGKYHQAFAPIPELAGATSISGAGCRYAVLMPGKRLASWVGWTGYPMPVFTEAVDAERVIVGGHLNGVAEICVLGSQSQCWDWSREPLRLTPAPALPPGVRDLAVDTEATCARIGDHVECWGRLGRLGNGETEYPRDLVPVAGITDARQLEAVGRTTCALRASGRVACWGEQLLDIDEDVYKRTPVIDREPVELPDVTDAVEIAMEGADRGDGTIGVAFAVCARRTQGATCWTSKKGQLVASDPPELARAVKLYSGPAVCGVSATGAVRCVRFDDGSGYIPGFEEADYEKYIYRGPSDGVRGRIAAVLGKRLHAALAAKRKPEGFRSAGMNDPVGRTAPAFQPPVGQLTDAIDLRRLEWTPGWDIDRVRGVLCARRGDGSVACWGERDYLGAGQHSTRSDPVTVANIQK